MRWLWIGMVALILGGAYLSASAAPSMPATGLWEFRVDKPTMTTKGFTDDERAHFRETVLGEFGIEAIPAVRRECLSAKAIRELKNLQAEAVPAGFRRDECSKRDPSGQSVFDAAGQCRKADGSIDLGYDASFQTAADRLTVDVKLDYRFADAGQGRTAGVLLRIDGRRIGDCDSSDTKSITDVIPS